MRIDKVLGRFFFFLFMRFCGCCKGCFARLRVLWAGLLERPAMSELTKWALVETELQGHEALGSAGCVLL